MFKIIKMEEDRPSLLVQDRDSLFRKWYWRDDWGAQRARFVERCPQPVSKVYLHYNTGTPPCYGKDECVSALQSMQTEQIRKDMNDILYNFIVTSGGNIYVGRGFGILPSAHLRYAYGDRLDIAFFGQWTKETLPYNMFKSSMVVVEMGIEQGYIKSELEVEPVIKKQKIPKWEAQWKQLMINLKKPKKPEKPKRPPGRRRNFRGKNSDHIRQYVAI